MKTLIKAEDVWLKFRINFVKKRVSMRSYLIQKAYDLMKGNGAEEAPAEGGNQHQGNLFWALRGMTFEVREGEVLGLLGRNGAGKSTLLMTLAGIYQPDRGRVEMSGRVGTLLSLSSGFNPEFSGRENIEASALFLGLDLNKNPGKVEEIIAFSELGDFIDAPLKTYSAGMRARLGFSVAIHMDPDILLIDEVLEAGDAAFRAKSNSIIKEMREKGKTIVIASHNLKIIETWCDRALLLRDGRMQKDGAATDVAREYEEHLKEKQHQDL